MCLVKEEHELRLVDVADLRQLFKQFRKQPQQEGGIEPGIGDQLIGRQDVDEAAAVAVLAHEIVDLERRLAEKLGCALVLQHQKLSLNGADGRGRDIAVLRPQVGRVVGDVAQDGAEVFQIKQ